MLYFGIPLRAREVSHDWNHVSALFERTLRSILSQTDANIHVLVGCHEIPDVPEKEDSRVEFLVSSTPVPKDKDEMMLDKGYKDQMIAVRLRELGGGFLMMVDSDDIVSSRIAAYVADHPDANGFLSRYGYVWNEGAPYVKRMLDPWKVCGSCAVVRYESEDLPERIPDGLLDRSWEKRFICRLPHRQIPVAMKERGRELSRIPFPTTVYVRGTGDNHSMLLGGDLGPRRKLELCLRRKIPKEKLRDEFPF